MKKLERASSTVIVLLITLMLTCASCAPKVFTRTRTVVKDSVIVREVTKQVMVKAPTDSVQLIVHSEELAPMPRLKVIREETMEGSGIGKAFKPFIKEKKGKRATIKIRMDRDGKITATATCDSLSQLVDVKVKEIERLHQELNTEVKVETEYRTRWIDKIGRVIAVLALAYIALKIWWRSRIF